MIELIRAALTRYKGPIVYPVHVWVGDCLTIIKVYVELEMPHCALCALITFFVLIDVVLSSQVCF